jgi:hypothetical protein
MLYDEHRKMGAEHARMGFPRYRWSDPHLQQAYDEGYRLIRELDTAVDQYMERRQNIAGLPGVTKKPRY